MSRYRHEDVASVPSGWKVRTVAHGNHRVRIAFPPGRKQTGSGRVVSILHPLKGENPCTNGMCTARSSNPAELMVMSANPPRRRNAEAKQQREGEKIRQNLLKLADRAQKKGLVQTANTYRELARKNPSELLVMGANPRIEVVHGENPGVEEIHEEFTGQEVLYVDVYNEPHMPRGRYAQLGPLMALFFKPVDGGPVLRIGSPPELKDKSDWRSYWGGDPPMIVTDDSAKQIYFVGGAQDISDSLGALHAQALMGRPGVYELGKVRRIDYECRKEHVAHPDEDLWKHNHGEEDGALPTLLFDARHKRLLYEGGNYRIEGPWVRN